MREPYSTLISASQLYKNRGQPNLVIFDCRFDLGDTTKGERAYQTSHVPGAIYAHLDHHLSSPITPSTGRHPLPDPSRLVDWLIRSGVNNESQIIAYDDTGGVMAVRIWWLMRWLGHQNVAVLDGGWQAWQAIQGPATDNQTELESSSGFDYQIHPEMELTTTQIVEELRSPTSEWLLVDARTPERHRGDHEPIDPIAGHIPGSLNIPLQNNLDAEGYFLSSDALKSLYQPLASHPLDKVACYCGSGVTACHNLLAMEIAGLKGARLYAGSWSEWIRDTSNPIALANH